MKHNILAHLAIGLSMILVTSGQLNSPQEISVIKELLTQIFRRYKTDMENLQSIVEFTTENLGQWRDEITGRLDSIEEQLGFGLVDIKQDGNDDNSPGKMKGFLERLAKLETLSRGTVARTCYQLRHMGVTKSGQYFIDPDGIGIGSPPVEVYCDMKMGTTRIDHDLYPQDITQCRERGCFVRPVNYKIPMKQIVSIISLSQHCEQYVRYDCKGAPLNSANESNAWWMDRNEEIHFYWSGDRSVELQEGLQGTCYCHMQGNCKDPNERCNCDAGVAEWSYDDGELTEKSQLPVNKLNFGNFYQEGQAAKVYLGPLYCRGEVQSPLEMDSCRSLWLAGVTNSGYQMVRTRGESFPRVVYCDMSKLPGSPGFQRNFGSPGNLKDFVAFDAYLTGDIEDNYRYIGFTDSEVNIGGGFNIEDGIFKVPVSGTYLFSAHALPKRNRPFNIQIQRNNRPIASFSNNKSGLSMSGQTIIVEVAEGDEIRLYNAGGEVEGSAWGQDIYFHFVGVLLNSYVRD